LEPIFSCAKVAIYKNGIAKLSIILILNQKRSCVIVVLFILFGAVKSLNCRNNHNP